RFEGIEEPLARIAGRTYLMDAARRLTLGAIDSGQKPAVVSAIVKRYLTEGMRAVVNDAMDIQAGAAIVRGPRNILAAAYASVPIGITVEGANILTRSLIIYGQGAIRCHPFVQHEINAIAANDLVALDKAFFGHVLHVVATKIRCVWHALTGARFAVVPGRGPVRRLFAQLTRFSAAYALVSDVAMATLGGTLKRRERLSGRLADALAWLYIGSAVAKRFHDEGQSKRDLPLFRWCAAEALFEIQTALQAVLDNLPNRPAAWFLRLAVFPLGARLRPANDRWSAAVAKLVLTDRDALERLTGDIFVPPPEEEGLGKLEAAAAKIAAAAPIDRKIRDAVRARKVQDIDGDAVIDAAQRAGVITEPERCIARAAAAARHDVVQVDSFPSADYLKQRR
ncbi:MAG: acyl-CoA dehydrogenase domain-containing protein, partial [Candidatus Eiseniibacteriota bacterium]